MKSLQVDMNWERATVVSSLGLSFSIFQVGDRNHLFVKVLKIWLKQPEYDQQGITQHVEKSFNT